MNEGWAYIYFATAGLSGPVKIGRSVNPEKRVAQLSTGSWVALEMLATIEVEDDRASDLEANIHVMFNEDRLRGEWFRMSPRLESFIRSLAFGYEQVPF